MRRNMSRDGGFGEMMDSKGDRITIKCHGREEEKVLAGTRMVNSTRSCLPEWWAEHHVNTCRGSLPPSKPVVGSFLRWDTYPGHSRLVPRLSTWLRDEERRWGKGLLDQSRSGLIYACRMKTFQTILKVLGRRGRQSQEQERSRSRAGPDYPTVGAMAVVMLGISRRSGHRRCLFSPSHPSALSMTTCP